MEPGDPTPVLTGVVRDRVVALASARLSTLAADAVPASVRPFARFTPAKRARLAAAPLAAALEADPAFRQAVAETAQDALPQIAAALQQGAALPDAPAEDVAAVAYLLRTPGWQDHVTRGLTELASRARAAEGVSGAEGAARLLARLETARAAARSEADALRVELASARQESAGLRRKVRELGDRAGRAEAAARLAEVALQQERLRVDALAAEAEAQSQQLAQELGKAQASVLAARQAARGGRATDEIRARVLLDALLGAAAGLRRELALPPVEARPADAVAGEYELAAGPGAARQGRADDDPALLDALLAVPLTHLLVDGYNVTKTGYGEQPLEVQRGRLLRGLGALAARTGAEVTVVFDGSERRTPVALAAPRGVRLLFSRSGETADDVLLRLVDLEPEGRPVLVVSSDREVADGSRRGGAQALPARALLRLLERG